jgi:hypothetical protein
MPLRQDEEMESDFTSLGDAFVFVRRGNVVAEHNYAVTRRFVGSQLAGLSGAPVMLLHDDEPGAISPFAMSKFGDPLEREGELIRREIDRSTCSRLGGVFVFRDIDSCLRASSLYGWDAGTVRHGEAFGHWRRYDMQIISALQDTSLAHDRRRDLWSHYWAGQAGSSFPDWNALIGGEVSHHDPLWEWLVDGYVHFDVEDASPTSA